MGIDRAEMSRRVSEFKSSGKSVIEYCQEHGYHPTRFYNWKKLTEGAVVKDKPNFARVQTGIKVTVELSGGVRLIDLPIESLAAVLKEVR